MRRIHHATFALAALLLPATVFAQAEGAPPQGDLTGALAWQLTDTGGSSRYDYWNGWDNTLFGGASAGWYWTPHLKSELEVGASVQADAFRRHEIIVAGRRTYQSSELEYSRRTVALSQQFQFFDNAWFHPYVAGGLNLTWQRQTESFEAAPVYDQATGRIVSFEPARVEGPVTEFTIRPFVAAGFKRYMTPRSYFRSELRLAFRQGLEESQMRAGFGFDW